MIDTLEKGIMAEEESEDKGHGVEEWILFILIYVVIIRIRGKFRCV